MFFLHIRPYSGGVIGKRSCFTYNEAVTQQPKRTEKEQIKRMESIANTRIVSV